MNNNLIDKILLELNEIILEKKFTIQKIYGFTKFFDVNNITPNILENKIKEANKHYENSTPVKNRHGRTLGDTYVVVVARILAGFTLNLYSLNYYNCEYLDTATNTFTKDDESDLLNQSDLIYFNMIISWYKMKEMGLGNDDIIDNLLSQEIVFDKNRKSSCTTHG